MKVGVQFSGKVRFTMEFAADATPQQMIDQVMAAAESQRYLEGKNVVKTIAVPGRIVNIVVK